MSLKMNTKKDPSYAEAAPEGPPSVTATRIERNMSAEEYHAHPAINASSLKVILEKGSVQHLIHQRANPRSSATYTRGHAIHALVLEGDEVFGGRFAKAPVDIAEYYGAVKCEFTNDYIETPPEITAFRSKADKQWKADREAEGLTVVKPDGWKVAAKDWAETAIQRGIQVLSDSDWERVQGCKSAIDAHPLASKFFEGGERELCIFWTDERTGLECKAMIDMWRDDMGVLVDLKSAQDASEDGFWSACARFGYYIQDEWYRRAIYAATGEYPRFFAFVVVEHEAPHGVGVYEVSPEYRDIAPNAVDAALDIWAAHLENPDAYQGYSPEIKQIAPPMWLVRKLEQYQ